MESYLSAKNVLHTILLNSDTTKILDEYIVSYLTLNPALVTNYINQNGLYHVYIRSMDPLRCIGDYYVMEMLQSFGTKLDAEKWIIQYGKDIIEHYDTSENGIVLCIIYHRNILYDTDESPSSAYGIAERKHPTYAFSQNAIEMLLDESQHFGCHTEREYHMNPRLKQEDLTWVTFIM
jgi:hypothetical protein